MVQRTEYTLNEVGNVTKTITKELNHDDADVTLVTAQYDALGHQIKKVTANSGRHDGTELYFYDGWKVIEVRDGSENVIQQAISGTQYIDEVVALILEDGVAFVHQDANWNVVALTDFASRTLERYKYTPYGQVTVDQETTFGDYDGDGRVTIDDCDTNDDDVCGLGDTCWGSSPSGACRVLDFDDDVDAADKTVFDALVSGNTYRRPGRTFSALGNSRFHQGLIYDAEIGSYNNRRRQYHPSLKSFGQRDPLALETRALSGYQDGMNLYGYVRNSPLVHLDPSGQVRSDNSFGSKNLNPTSTPNCSGCWCERCLFLPDCWCCLCLVCDGILGIWFVVMC